MAVVAAAWGFGSQGVGRPAPSGKIHGGEGAREVGGPRPIPAGAPIRDPTPARAPCPARGRLDPGFLGGRP